MIEQSDWCSANFRGVIPVNHRYVLTVAYSQLNESLGNCRGSRVRGRGSRVRSRGSRVRSRKSRVRSRGSQVEGRKSRVEGRKSRVEGRMSRVEGCKSRVKDHRSRVGKSRSRVKTKESKFKCLYISYHSKERSILVGTCWLNTKAIVKRLSLGNPVKNVIFV